MKKNLLPLTIGLVLVAGLAMGTRSFSQTPQPQVKLQVEPAIEQLRPFEAEANQPQTPATFTLQAVDGSNQPLTNARLRLQLLTPAANPFLPTDFPIVEGTKLLDLTTNAPEGKVQFQQMLPIRGTYQLKVTVEPQQLKQFPAFQQFLPLSVRENPVKYRNFAVLAAILLLAGLIGGWVIGGPANPNLEEAMPQRVRLLLSGTILLAIVALLVVNISSELSESHDHHHHPEAVTQVPQQSSQGVTAELGGDRTATVGQAAHLWVRVRDRQTGQPLKDAVLAIRATQAEENWLTFAYEGRSDAQGELHWQQQFFDGSPHQVTVTVAPTPDRPQAFPPFQISRTLEVEAVAPPLFGRMVVLGYFTGIVVLGLLLGLKLRQRPGRRGDRSLPSLQP